MPDNDNQSARTLETPDITRTQWAAIVQLIVALAAIFGIEVTAETSATLLASLVGASSVFGGALVALDAAIRRARAQNADKIAGVPRGPIDSSEQAIPATGWWASTEGRNRNDWRPIAVWRVLPDPDSGQLKLSGLVQRNHGFVRAEDVENFAGYEYAP